MIQLMTFNDRIHLHHGRQLVLLGLLVFMAWSVHGKGVPDGSSSQRDAIDKNLRFAYYPTMKKVEINIEELPTEMFREETEITAGVRLSGQSKLLTQKKFQVSDDGGNCMLDLPALSDGTYELVLQIGDGVSEIRREFVHKNFKWFGNTIGMTDKVYAPFKPIRVAGKNVDVVLRTYRMNGFGLWDQVISEGKELLTGPMVLHLITDKGTETWDFRDGKWTAQAGNRAVYEATAEAPSIRIKSKSIIDYDGAMKVEMEFSPGKSKGKIQRLWLEVPLKDTEAPLFHYSTVPNIRRNYSGATPHGGKIVWSNHPDDTQNPPNYFRGGANAPVWKAQPGSNDGVVWTNRDIRPWEHVWKTDFVPYIWLGGATRGIAWFGASPRGYKLDSKGIMQRIERAGSTLRLQVDFINRPGVLSETHKIVFGLQASPTKPMPDDWRSNVAMPGIDAGVHCAPWGAHGCSDKYPDDDDFRVVDEIINVRQTGVLNPDPFIKLNADRTPHFRSMTNHQDTTWLAWVMAVAKVNQALTVEADDAEDGVIEGALLVPYRYHIDASKHEVNYIWKTLPKDRIYPERVTRKIRNAPLAMYFEEHASTIVNKEWEVYQDEWRGRRVHKERSKYVAEPPQATNNFGVGRQGFPRSYQDFALWYANEWMKRGVSIYCDNVFLQMQDNPLTSEAFIDEEGDLQPATSLWELREYHKRLWQLAQEWNGKGTPYPIVIVHHMTNSIMLPIHTWNSSMLDDEYPFRSSRPDPFPAEYLLAQAAGHQTGSYRHLLESVQRLRHGTIIRESVEEMDTSVIRTEWGMRMVHEAMRWLFPNENFAAFEPGRTLEKAVWDFGYGLDDCKVVNYWADEVPLTVNDSDAKWLLMQRTRDKRLMLVLQSYQKDDLQVEITIDPAKIGFTPRASARDVESGKEIMVGRAAKKLLIKTLLPGQFGTKVLIIGAGT